MLENKVLKNTFVASIIALITSTSGMAQTAAIKACGG